MWCKGIVPVPLLFFHNFWATNHVKRHLWGYRSKLPCYSSPSPCTLALEQSYFLLPCWSTVAGSQGQCCFWGRGLCREDPELLLMWAEALIENRASWFSFFLSSRDHPDSELWNRTNYIHSHRETECELNFRSIQASLHPSRSSCFQFCFGTLYWEAEGSVFRKVIGVFWSILWGNNCSVTSLCFYIWASLWERNRFFLWNQETVFSMSRDHVFNTYPSHPISILMVPDFRSSLPLYCKHK